MAAQKPTLADAAAAAEQQQPRSCVYIDPLLYKPHGPIGADEPQASEQSFAGSQWLQDAWGYPYARNL